MNQPPKIEIIAARLADAPVLANLLELYLHDFSEFHQLEMGADGKFGYKNLPLYWTEDNRHAFLLKVDAKLAGMALVKRGSGISGDSEIWDLAEFFVARGYRRRGIGTGAAQAVWSRFPGLWEVRVMESNISAHRFWEHAISVFTGEKVPASRVENSGKTWFVFSFHSKRGHQ